MKEKTIKELAVELTVEVTDLCNTIKGKTVFTNQLLRSYHCGGGYTVHQIQPVDMFPHTEHVEVVTLMTRKETN